MRGEDFGCSRNGAFDADFQRLGAKGGAKRASPLFEYRRFWTTPLCQGSRLSLQFWRTGDAPDIWGSVQVNRRMGAEQSTFRHRGLAAAVEDDPIVEAIVDSRVASGPNTPIGRNTVMQPSLLGTAAPPSIAPTTTLKVKLKRTYGASSSCVFSREQTIITGRQTDGKAVL